MRALLARLLRPEIERIVDARGPGGHAITPQERAEARPLLAQLIAEAVALQQDWDKT